MDTDGDSIVSKVFPVERRLGENTRQYPVRYQLDSEPTQADDHELLRLAAKATDAAPNQKEEHAQILQARPDPGVHHRRHV